MFSAHDVIAPCSCRRYHRIVCAQLQRLWSVAYMTHVRQIVAVVVARRVAFRRCVRYHSPNAATVPFL